MTELLEILRWVGGIAALAFGLLCIVGNWMTLIHATVAKRGTSFILLFGGVLTAVGMLMIPIPNLWRWAWLPPFLDFGTIPLFAWAAIARLFRRRKSTDRSETGPD